MMFDFNGYLIWKVFDLDVMCLIDAIHGHPLKNGAVAVSAGSAAVLLIFILIFNLSARKIGDWLHAKLTSAQKK